MESTVKLEQVEALAMQLPAAERLKLAARLCERASEDAKGFPVGPVPGRRWSEEEIQRERARLDAAAALWEGQFDAAAEIRQMRAERDEQIWPSK